MTGRRQRVYVDSTVYCSLFMQEEIIEGPFPRWQIAKDLLSRDEQGSIEIVTSALTIAEVNGGRMADQTVRDKISAYFNDEKRLIIEVDFTRAARARELRWRLVNQGRLMGNSSDLVHLACAIEHNCEVLYTWDKKHLIPLSGLLGIEIVKPEIDGQLALDPKAMG